MNFFSRYKFPFFSALLIALLFTAIFSAIIPVHADSLFILGLILFLVSFLITWTLTKVFIYRKIAAIKNSIRQSRSEQAISGSKQPDILSELENEMAALNIERKEES